MLPRRLEALVALPAALSQAVAMMDVILGARQSVTWFLKCHPHYPPSAFLTALDRQLAKDMTLVDGHIADWMNRVDIVITTASGTALEAAAAGIPVVVLGSPNELTFNPLEWFDDEAARPCFSSRDLDERISRLASADDVVSSLATEVRDKWFAPVTEAALAEFIA
jgi:hypothetical protein